MTFLPYVIIIYYDAKLTGALRFFTNLTFTSAFSYAWDYIMRMELQGNKLSFGLVFSEGLTNEFTYAFVMIIMDTFIYAIIGYLIETFFYDEFKFHIVPRSTLDPNTGASLTNISKIYDTQRKAVDDVCLILPRNQISCILGRNGAGSPNLVILDEPCNGIDSRARKYVWDLIKLLRKDRAVFLSTHYLDEAEYLSDSITIMHNGK
uniref:ABC transporter domain-containing protein n=1 Tax=Megaselia scalaris TaxID=36166 RepID=T1GWN7_MEGSC